MNKKLVWKVLSDDGLLKEPKPCGAYYSESDINPYGGFDSEEEAVDKLAAMKEIYSWDMDSEYVLITVYIP